MPSLKLSNPFRRGADRPSLKDRAAALKATAGRVIRRPIALPAPGSDEARAAFAAACQEHDRLTRAATIGHPDLKRSPLGWWTKQSLGRAREMGEISAAECARLYPLASARELRIEAAAHRLNLGALHALAFADDPPLSDEVEEGDDPAYGAIWEHRRAYAAWKPHLDAITGAAGGSIELAAAEAASEQYQVREGDAFGALVETQPTTLGGMLALTKYLLGAIRRNGRDDEGADSVTALASICDALHAAAERGAIVADPAPVDWHSPPPGFMAHPAIEPGGFVKVAHGIRIEVGRLYVIALAEFERRRGAYDGRGAGPDAGERVAQLRRSLRLDALAAALAEPDLAELMGADQGAAEPSEQGVSAEEPEAHLLNDLKGASVNKLARLYDHLQGLAHIASMACNAPMAWDNDRENLGPVGNFLEAEHARLDGLVEQITTVIRGRSPAGEGERDDRLVTLVKRELEVHCKVDDAAVLADIATTWGP